jgi:hypothetical protein
MARETNTRAVPSAAQKAAMQMLRVRADVIGEASVPRHRVEQLAADLTEAKAKAKAKAEYIDTLARARDLGWTPAELHGLGLDEASDGASDRRRRPARSSAPAARTPGAATAPGQPATDPDAVTATTVIRRPIERPVTSTTRNGAGT